MAKEIVKKQNNEVSTNTSSFDASSFLDGGIEREDIKIPKLLITQPMTTAKRENKDIKDGDIFLSNSKEVVLSQGEEMNFIPLYTEKLVSVFKNEGNDTYEGSKKGKWEQTYSQSYHDKSLADITQTHIYNKFFACYVTPLNTKLSSLICCRLDFKGSSKNSFQPMLEKIISFAESGQANNPAHPNLELLFKLKVIEKTNAKNQLFYVLDVKYHDLASVDQQNLALKQLSMVKNLNESSKYDDSDEETPSYAK